MDPAERLLYFAAFLLMSGDDDHASTKTRRRRRTKRLLVERPLRGEFPSFMEREMRIDPASFYETYRMSPSTFKELVKLVAPHIDKEVTYMKYPLRTPERLGITLRYLALGASQKDVARHFSVGRSTVCNLIGEVCSAIWESLAPLFMARPSAEDWKKIAEDFSLKRDFPGCLGAVDGKHIQVLKPALSGSLDFNYKRTFSMVLLAVADSACRFTYIDVGAYGHEHDSSIFAQSAFGQQLDANGLDLPEQQHGELPYVFVGDEPFPLKHNLLRPYPGKNLDNRKAGFNQRLSCARKVVENAFSILVSKWRILHQPIIAKPSKVDSIIKAICVLHNFMQEKGVEEEYTNVLQASTGIKDIDRRLGANMYSQNDAGVRDRFADYFQTPQGKLPCQDAFIDREQQNQ